MPSYSDRDIWELRYSEYGHVPSDARAAEFIAAKLGHEVSSVRGRLSRADTPGARLWLAEQIATNPPRKPISVERQEAVFKASRKSLAASRARRIQFHNWNATVIGLYDIHYPYTRFDAMELALQITADEQPTYVVYGGDINDNEGFGRWPDDRSPYERLFSADYRNNRVGEFSITKSFAQVSPETLALYLNGNHDQWRYDFLRKHDPQQAEDRIALYVEALWAQDIHVFSTTREEKVSIHEKLDMWHGQFTSSNHLLNARNTIGQFVENGQAKSIVVGHSHRPAHVPGGQVGYSGVDYWNAPCLSRVERVPWLDRDPRAWGLGIFYGEMTEHGVRGENILFTEQGKKLVAKFNGRKYETELKD